MVWSASVFRRLPLERWRSWLVHAVVDVGAVLVDVQAGRSLLGYALRVEGVRRHVLDLWDGLHGAGVVRREVLALRLVLQLVAKAVRKLQLWRRFLLQHRAEVLVMPRLQVPFHAWKRKRAVQRGVLGLHWLDLDEGAGALLLTLLQAGNSRR